MLQITKVFQMCQNHRHILIQNKCIFELFKFAYPGYTEPASMSLKRKKNIELCLKGLDNLTLPKKGHRVSKMKVR